MKTGQRLVRQSRFGLACIVFLSSSMSPLAFAQSTANYRTVSPDSSLLRVQQSLVQPNLIDDLFPADPVTNPTTPNPTPNTPTPDNGGICGFAGCTPGTPGGFPGTNGGFPGTNGGFGGYFPNSPYQNPWGYDPRRMDRATVGQDFQCNLFENTPLSEMLSSLTALGTVVNRPGCQGTVNLQSVVAENNKIAEVIKNLRPYVENPETVSAEKVGEIGAAVDVAIQSASNLAATFANTAAFSKECREGMNAGQIATSLNSVINGLTPYALMAAGLTAGTAAVPFIVGGAVLTTAISSVAQIVDQNTVNIGDPLVRQAVVENTCQFIRLEQKYKFLIKGRKDQIRRISQEISISQSMFSSRVKGVSPAINALLVRRGAIEQTAREMNDQLGNVDAQFQSDKVFFNTAGNALTACNFGVAVAKTTDDKTSYSSVMLGSLDQAMAVYGKSSGVQGDTLKSNAAMAIQSLKAFSASPTHSEDDIKNCATMAKSLVKTVEDSAMVSKQLLKLAKGNVERDLQKNKDFGMLRASIGAMDQKKVQADRVTDSLETLRRFANAITQSEINSSMDKIRRSLFSRSKMIFKAPVLKWFEYTEQLHKADVDKFSNGLGSLRATAYKLTPSGKASVLPRLASGRATLIKDQEDAKQLRPFNLKNVPLDTQVHANVCRELRDVWDRWVKSVDHLMAMNSFCGLLEPYVYDNRDEDAELVAICRSDKKERPGKNGTPVSHLVALKNKLITEYKRDWALVIDKKLDELVCLDSTTFTGGSIAPTPTPAPAPLK
jgi:hypothetical protein